MLRGNNLHALFTLTAILIAVPSAGPVSADSFHKVSKGETVYGIAKQHRVSVQKVLNVNGLSEKSVLSIGKMLRIPDSSVTSVDGSTVAEREAVTEAKRLQYSEQISSETPDENSQPEVADTNSQKSDNENCRWNALIRTAMAHRGVRYRFGGTSRGGFDCSGFTRYVYAKYGVALPHSSKSQFNRGTAVSKSELKPGDLVFFHTNRSGISHVGIYIGENKFVHASNTRRGVTVDSLSSAYYSSRYRGARRIE